MLGRNHFSPLYDIVYVSPYLFLESALWFGSPIGAAFDVIGFVQMLDSHFDSESSIVSMIDLRPLQEEYAI